MNIKYTKATLRDIDIMQLLVEPEVVSGLILQRNNDEIATNIRSYTLAYNDSQLVGFCALHIHTPSLGEIRSLIVKDSYRRNKIGETLVKKSLQEGKDLGLQKVLTLTYRQTFFEKLGFIEIAKESLPKHKIWADCIKCKHFPVCDEVSLLINL